MRIILVFVDGIGLGPDDPERNPLAEPGLMAAMERLTGRRLLAAEYPWENGTGGGAAVDAVLGVPGLPQSATGQVTLLTGINAQALLGRHENGFPGTVLRRCLTEHSLFRRLREIERPGIFANAFTPEYFAAVAAGRWRHSATTLAALAGGVRLRFLPELLNRKAVYQDLTNEGLRERGYDVPRREPEEAGTILARTGEEHPFTLFEYFQTDLAGHGGGRALAAERLRQLDRFLGRLLEEVDLRETLVVAASDHGNIEDLATRGHTGNPVPVLAFGAGHEEFLAGLSRLDQLAGRIIAAVESAPRGVSSF